MVIESAFRYLSSVAKSAEDMGFLRGDGIMTLCAALSLLGIYGISRMTKYDLDPPSPEIEYISNILKKGTERYNPFSRFSRIL